MFKTSTTILLCLLAFGAHAQRLVMHDVSFETGSLQPNGSGADAGFIKTLPHPQNGREAYQHGRGGCGPTSDCDMRVVSSEVVDGQTVRPRAGNYFLRIMLYKDKDYSGVNGGGLNKPRNSLTFTDQSYRFDFDTEQWVGFSIFVPNGFEDETEAQGIVLTDIGTGNRAQFATLSIGMGHRDTQSRWYLNVSHSDTSTTRGSVETIDLGSIEPDKGQWTDFVIRLRANPFSKNTNPSAQGISGANNQLYEGNKGILQVWKSEGSADSRGDREMVNVVNKVNTPVGLVPGTVQRQSKLKHDIRVYKGGWQGHRGRGSSVQGPIWIGWDEYRFGQTMLYGTGYADVNPSGQACTDACSSDGGGSGGGRRTRR